MADNEIYKSDVIEGWISRAPLVAPEFYHCAPDNSTEMGMLEEAYFRRVTELLGYNQRAKEHFLHIESEIMAFEDGSGIYPTNDRITTLKAQDKLIAYTYEARDSFNFIDYSLVCTLNQEILDLLRSNPACLE
jgi:hypothetical protein